MCNQKNQQPHFCKLLIFRAENGTRTRDLNLGKVVLYQLSYFRNMFFGLRKGFHPSFRHPKLAFRDCKYKLKNLFCKIFRQILSQNDIPGLRKSRGHRMGNPYIRAAE